MGAARILKYGKIKVFFPLTLSPPKACNFIWHYLEDRMRSEHIVQNGC